MDLDCGVCVCVFVCLDILDENGNPLDVIKKAKAESQSNNDAVAGILYSPVVRLGARDEERERQNVLSIPLWKELGKVCTQALLQNVKSNKGWKETLHRKQVMVFQNVDRPSRFCAIGNIHMDAQVVFEFMQDAQRRCMWDQTIRDYRVLCDIDESTRIVQLVTKESVGAMVAGREFISLQATTIDVERGTFLCATSGVTYNRSAADSDPSLWGSGADGPPVKPPVSAHEREGSGFQVQALTNDQVSPAQRNHRNNNTHDGRRGVQQAWSQLHLVTDVDIGGAIPTWAVHAATPAALVEFIESLRDIWR